LLYVVGSEQRLHFEQAFAIAKLAGWDGHFVHIPFGIWRFPEGKMSTRKGKLVTAEELIDEAISQVRTLLKERRIEAEEVEYAIETIALASLTYNELALSPNVVSTFTWERVLLFEGRSAPYLLYTYARIRSIERKARELLKAQSSRLKEVPSAFTFEPLATFTPEERALAVKLIHYPEVVARAGEEYAPYLLASYLYELAERFNLFYQKVPVLNAETDETRYTRLELVHACDIVLKNGLSLLNINTLERM
ncbi:MAG: arginine--tRNA ligase, partial [Parcubacteria group bacterium]|nr:arginine--tRNA ligase [Parcubacteria group bacterium]